MPAAETVSLIATNRMGHESNITGGGGLKEKGMEEKKTRTFTLRKINFLEHLQLPLSDTVL